MIPIRVNYFKLVGDEIAVVDRLYNFEIKWNIQPPGHPITTIELFMRWYVNGEPQADVYLGHVLPSVGSKTITIYPREKGTITIEAYPCIRSLVSFDCYQDYKDTLTVRVADESEIATLNISSDKEGVNVYVDGKEIGVAPVTTVVEPGKHVIEVVGKDCYGRKEIEVSAGETKHITVKCGSTWEKYMVIAIAMIGLLAFVKMRGERGWSQRQ